MKIKLRNQRKSESGRQVLRERRQRQKRQREKKGKVKKRQGKRENMEGPRRAWARMEMPFSLGFSYWECIRRLLPGKLFYDMRCLWGSISKWNVAHDHLLLYSDQRLGTSTSWKPEPFLKIGRWCSPNTHYLKVPLSYLAFHNPFSFLLLTSHLDCKCPMDKYYIMLPFHCFLLGNVPLLFKLKVYRSQISQIRTKKCYGEFSFKWLAVLNKV